MAAAVARRRRRRSGKGNCSSDKGSFGGSQLEPPHLGEEKKWAWGGRRGEKRFRGTSLRKWIRGSNGEKEGGGRKWKGTPLLSIQPENLLLFKSRVSPLRRCGGKERELGSWWRPRRIESLRAWENKPLDLVGSVGGIGWRSVENRRRGGRGRDRAGSSSLPPPSQKLFGLPSHATPGPPLTPTPSSSSAPAGRKQSRGL